MTEFRSEAEIFVTNFLDYVGKYDILDELDKRRNVMVRSPGIQKLIDEAQKVFPPRADDGKAETDKLAAEQVEEAIVTAPNVIDRRDVFARKIQVNGAARGLLEAVLKNETGALELAREFVAAENGEKQFKDDK